MATIAMRAQIVAETIDALNGKPPLDDIKAIVGKLKDRLREIGYGSFEIDNFLEAIAYMTKQLLWFAEEQVVGREAAEPLEAF
jgi:hypothetical protein